MLSCLHALTSLQDRVTLSTWGRATTCRQPHARLPLLTCRQASIAAGILGRAWLRGDLSHPTVPWQQASLAATSVIFYIIYIYI